jgi:hypothetical protein
MLGRGGADPALDGCHRQHAHVSAAWVKRRLAFWGRWARTGMPGLPTMCATEKARSGRGGIPDDAMPTDIAEIDHLVCKAPLHVKIVLIVYYAQTGQVQEKANRLGLSRWQFRRRLDQGESFVAMNL